MSSNYNLQAFTHGSVSADETHALVEYQGTWYDWDFAFVEGAGDGVLWERGTNDWKITKTSNGYKAEKTNGFSTADTFQPDSNGIVTISFSWSDHTGLKFKPPVISSGGGTSTEGVAVLNGSWSTLADGTYAYTIGSSSPTSSTANGLYDIRFTNAQSGVVSNMFQPNGISHTSLTDTTGYISSTTNDGLYELIHIGSSLDSFPITVLASMRIGNKKVFCNFW